MSQKCCDVTEPTLQFTCIVTQIELIMLSWHFLASESLIWFSIPSIQLVIHNKQGQTKPPPVFNWHPQWLSSCFTASTRIPVSLTSFILHRTAANPSLQSCMEITTTDKCWFQTNPSPREDTEQSPCRDSCMVVVSSCMFDVHQIPNNLYLRWGLDSYVYHDIPDQGITTQQSQPSRVTECCNSFNNSFKLFVVWVRIQKKRCHWYSTMTGV